ncbi:HAD family hydrolase [Parvularcula sp. IMCC14364]|uniref:HAD-IIIC family phosphatase n=1 Tax=Parvularcula sp. IMCC14364 TaxID=3067902 RepID=UPI0027410B54|nr:HAD-IIIC family phosphatase [Parvularcula sp. IMCC14364]
MTDTEARIVLSATFTADPVADILSFWADQFAHPVAPAIAPYAQVYQQLLDAGSLLRRNRHGANVVLVRWHDLAVDLPNAYARAARELSDAVLAMQHDIPLLVVLCPAADRREETDEADTIFLEAVAGMTGLATIRADEAFERYACTGIHNLQGDQIGKIPYTDEAFAAIGTSVYRWFDARRRKPLKMLAVDCDNTLWGGVVGEDGATGIDLGDGYRALQEQLVRQVDGGRIVCLLSKNDASDVEEVFAQRQDMVLSSSHIVSQRINWEAKPDNLTTLTSELNLGLDSVLFLDDSTVECAAMRAFCPEVQTVKVPQQADEFESFVRHLWLFDQPGVTKEDKSRVQMYKEQVAREESRRAAVSLEDFFAELELEVTISAPTAAQLGRFSQLTLRTNQFNASLARLTEPQVQQIAAEATTALRVISARDRFGDYGIVGALCATARETDLEADVFLLSCRAMGRGIEHGMVAELGRIADNRGLSHVTINLQEGPRNHPALSFLSSLGSAQGDIRKSGCVRLSADAARVVSFQPGTDSAPDAAPASGAPGARRTANDVRPDAVYQKIATEWITAASILDAMRGAISVRPEMAISYVAPSTHVEQKIAGIWQRVLRLEKVGINDPFGDLGGKSIQLVQIHALLQQELERRFEFTLLFEHSTIASLARQLATKAAPGEASSGMARAQKMRAARNRRSVSRQQKSAVS